tara:strand:+ start:2665 stop:3342 length:678 start_codon:yes stop_codon:yes gene_type:complete
MDRLPDIGNIEDDLKIVSMESEPKTEAVVEDLKGDPFDRSFKAPPIKPEKKMKKPVSAKQKQHLANARKLAKERRAELKRQKEEELKAIENEKQLEKEKDALNASKPKQEKKVKMEDGSTVNVEEEEVYNDEEKQFINWMKQMDRFSEMTLRHNQEKKKAEELRLKKEKELEEKYYKKFLAEGKIKTDNEKKQSKSESKPKSIPKANLDLLNKVSSDYGEYSNYF